MPPWAILARRVPKRLVPGILYNNRVPRDELDGYNALLREHRAAGGPIQSALFWTDGKRDLADITRLPGASRRDAAQGALWPL